MMRITMPATILAALAGIVAAVVALVSYLIGDDSGDVWVVVVFVAFSAVSGGMHAYQHLQGGHK